MTIIVTRSKLNEIIPYQELLGNYDRLPGLLFRLFIIPYQELLGNYDIGG